MRDSERIDLLLDEVMSLRALVAVLETRLDIDPWRDFDNGEDEEF